VEYPSANHVAPPVPVESVTVTYEQLTVPDDLLKVAATPALDEFIVISLPEVPLTLNALVIVVVVLAGKVNVLALVTSLKLIVPKVLAPVITKVPVDPATV
jgi:hypothetical protein